MFGSLYPKLFSARSDTGRRHTERLVWFFQNKVRTFFKVPTPVLLALAEAATPRRYVQKQYIWNDGDPARELWVMLEGRGCLNRIGPQGNNVKIEIITAGELFGLRALSCRVHMSTMQATQDIIAASIPREVVLRQIARHPELARALFLLQGERLNFIESQLLLAREPVPMRLAAALVYLYHKFGATLPLTRAEIGEMAGTTPETTMRVLRKFTECGFLLPGARQVAIVDLSALRAKLAVSLPDLWPLPGNRDARHGF